MDQKIKATPTVGNRRKGPVQRRIIGDVDVDQEIAPQRTCQRFDTLAEHLALIAERQFGPGCMQRLGDPPGDGMVVGHPHDQAAFAVH